MPSRSQVPLVYFRLFFFQETHAFFFFVVCVCTGNEVTCQIENILIGSHLQHLQAAHRRLVGGGLQVSTILIHIRGLVLQGGSRSRCQQY